MNDIDTKIKHSQRRKKMMNDKAQSADRKVRKLEEKGYQPKPLEEEYKRKKMRVRDVFKEGNREEDE